MISERFSPHQIELGDGDLGCYLIHGFTGSTYELQGLAEFLAANGYRVHAPLLAGHGTTVEECNLVHAEDWLSDTEFHFTEFSLTCTSTFVVGLSMGASLALHLSTLFPIAGVVVMSPAMILNSRTLRWTLPLVTLFKSSIPKNRTNEEGNGGQHQHYGYKSYPLRGLRAMIKLNRYVRSELPRVTTPALIMHSRADATVPFKNATMVFDQIGSEDKALITYHQSGHVLPDESEKERVWEQVLDFMNQHRPV